MKKNRISQFVSANGLLLVILLAFTIRMIFFVSLKPWNDEVVNKTVITGDAIEYHPLALSIITNKSFEDFSEIRTPGYPLFVALIYSFSSCSVWLVLFIQILLSLVSVLLVYKITVTLFSHNIALLSSLLFAIDATQALWTVELYTETLFLLLFLISIYFLCIGIRDGRLSLICLSSLFLGIATLVRPILSMFPFVAVIVILLLTNFKLRIRVAQSLIFVVIFIATISPWLIHNHSKYGETKLSSISGFNLLYYNAAYTEVYKTGKTIEEVHNRFNDVVIRQGADTANIRSFKNSKILSGVAKEYIKDNFVLYGKRHFMGIVNMYAGLGTKKITSVLHLKTESLNDNTFGGPGIFTRIFSFLHNKTAAVIIIAFMLGLYLLINYLFSLYGIVILTKKRERFLILFILIILYFSVLTGVIGYDRYRIPFMPFINILCAIGLIRFYEKLICKLNKVKK